jgi:DNA-binding transcriptional regulator YhcF (GntR family)
MATDREPPYLRIVREIRHRIATGALRPGDRVPSTRQLTREFGVAMATASKVLATLGRDGLVHTVPRVGAVVAAPPAADRPTSPDRAAAADRPTGLDRDATRDRIVRAAIEIADAEGLDAVSMRGVAGRLGVPTMSLYRHVAAKDELVALMTDAAFGEAVPPADLPADWRTRLTAAARLQWTLYHRHPWLAHLVPLGRPLPVRNLMVHGEYVMRALEGHRLDAATVLQVHIILYSYVRGLAANLEAEAEARAATGLTEEQWVDSQTGAFAAIAADSDFPAFGALLAGLGDGYDFDLDRIFEFGLAMTLDGIGALIASAAGP